MTDGKALWKAIAARPGEDTPKLALADWYEEHGDGRMSHALRWCVARRTWPLHGPRRSLWIRQVSRPGRNHLPAVVFDALAPRADGTPPALLSWDSWRSPEAAIRALAKSLAKLRSACEVPS